MRIQRKTTDVQKKQNIKIRRLEDVFSKSKIEQFDADTELWETGKLGASAEHARTVSRKEDQALDEALGLQLISIRIQKPLIKQLKRLAKLEGMGYQTFMRQILTRYAGENKHKLHGSLAFDQVAEQAEQLLVKALKYKKIIPTLKPMSSGRISGERDYSKSLAEANVLFGQAYKRCSDPVIKKHLKLRINQIIALIDEEVEMIPRQKYKKVS